MGEWSENVALPHNPFHSMRELHSPISFNGNQSAKLILFCFIQFIMNEDIHSNEIDESNKSMLQ